MVRLWVGGEDYGTMHERAAQSYKRSHDKLYPNEACRIEPVPDDAPDFLPRPGISTQSTGDGEKLPVACKVVKEIEIEVPFGPIDEEL